MVHSIAALGKLYSEQIEGIDPGPLEAVRATGANELQTVVYAVVPQIIPPFISFTIYRWDINVRMSTIIGLVGGGGVGPVAVPVPEPGAVAQRQRGGDSHRGGGHDAGQHQRPHPRAYRLVGRLSGCVSHGSARASHRGRTSMYYGADYYPEHWPETRWDDDARHDAGGGVERGAHGRVRLDADGATGGRVQLCVAGPAIDLLVPLWH